MTFHCAFIFTNVRIDMGHSIAHSNADADIRHFILHSVSKCTNIQLTFHRTFSFQMYKYTIYISLCIQFSNVQIRH